MNQLPVRIGFEVEYAIDNGDARGSNDSIAVEIGTVTGKHVAKPYHYCHSDGSCWDIKTDSSCGWEVASPIVSTLDELTKAAKAIAAIARNGGHVNNDCGLHVHVELPATYTAQQVQNVMRFMSRYEKAFYRLAHTSRTGNRFCQPLDQSIVERAKVAKTKSAARDIFNGQDRRRWINGLHFNSRRTLEFRIKESTLNPDEIIGWIMFLILTIDNCISKNKKVSWGEAKASSDRDMIQTMLGQAGFYGPFSNEESKRLIELARRWALGSFVKFSGEPGAKTTKRTTIPPVSLYEELIG